MRLRLERTERVMVRRMCGVTLSDRIKSDELIGRLGIESVTEVVSRGRLRWFGHLERMDGENWVTACRKIKVEGKVGRGRGRKTWQECVNVTMKERGLKSEMTQDRVKWRRGIHGSSPTPASREIRTLKR